MQEKEIETKIIKYSDMIYRLCVSILKNKDDSEDVYQDVIIKFCKKIDEFENEAHEKAWLIRVTINQCKNVIRTSWFKNRSELDENIAYFDKEEDSVYYEVSKLPTKYRAVIHLFYYEDYKISEICKILGQKESTVKSQLRRARHLLEKKIKGGMDGE